MPRQGVTHSHIRMIVMRETRRQFFSEIGLSAGVSSVLSAQGDWPSRIRSLRPPGSSGADPTLENLDERLRRTLAALSHAESAAEADKARPGLRKKLEASLGFRQFPWPPDLNARTTGVVRRSEYRIEKVVYQTLPNVLVPAHLYLPEKLVQRVPAVIFFNGHWHLESKTKPDFQAFCINMARLGFLVLNFDPVGQGERGVSSRDHRRAAALLVGVSQQGINEYETQCALAYLLSRDEVDPKRIGMTGASGGGYNAWMTVALDERIAAAVPVVGTSEFYGQSKGRIKANWGPKDHCHKVPGLNTYANNHELLAMAAARPLLIVAASRDPGFPIGGVRKVYEYGRRLYESYGVPGRLGLFVDTSSGHGYQQKKREAAYGWFLRWLMNHGDGRPVPEPVTQTEPFDSLELRCFPPGENRPAGPGIISSVKRLMQNIPGPSGVADLGHRLGKLPDNPPQRPQIRDVVLQRLVIPSEQGLEVPAFLAKPRGRLKGVVVGMHDKGKQALATEAVLQEALDAGWAVCGVDPRGNGELTTAHGGWIFAVSLMLGENFIWRQGWDLSQAARYLSASGLFAGRPMVLYGRGHDSSLAVTYALQMPPMKQLRLGGFILEDGFVSFRQFVDRPRSLPISYRLQHCDPKEEKPLDREIPAAYFVFDALRSFDLPDLLKAVKLPGLVINPINGDWERMAEKDATQLLPSGIQLAVSNSTEQQIRALLAAVSP
jgi:dienelactone hydrolase